MKCRANTFLHMIQVHLRDILKQFGKVLDMIRTNNDTNNDLRRKLFIEKTTEQCKIIESANVTFAF